MGLGLRTGRTGGPEVDRAADGLAALHVTDSEYPSTRLTSQLADPEEGKKHSNLVLPGPGFG